MILNIMDMEKAHVLNQFQEISLKMLDLAEAKDWDKLPDLENKRKILMQSFFEQPVSLQDSVQVEQVIQDLLLINDQITQLAQQEKTSIGHELQGLKKRQDVHSAYLQNQ